MKSQIVYIREADNDVLPDEIRKSGMKLFSVHDAENGQTLAVAPDRRLAFALARKNDLTPLSVH